MEELGSWPMATKNPVQAAGHIRAKTLRKVTEFDAK